MRILSWGGGLQSSTLGWMSVLGVLPKLDFAVFADTGSEMTATTEYVRETAVAWQQRGLKTVIVYPRPKQLSAPGVDAWGAVLIPAFSSTGQIKRQCTSGWKLDPIRRFLRWLGAGRNGLRVETWIGFTRDEVMRVGQARDRWNSHFFPFLEPALMPDGRMWSRNDCEVWLRNHDLEIPIKSRCAFCPFQSKGEWLQVSHSQDWRLAVKVDEAIRNRRLPGQLYVHRCRRALTELDFQEQLEFDLWEGVCSANCAT